jgi:hypothetical protein
MNLLISEIITEISIYSVLIPIAFGIRGFKSSPFILKVFFIFLCYGGSVDLVCSFSTEPTLYFTSFTIIQVLFYTWFLYQVFKQKKLRTAYISLTIFWCLFYLFCHIILLNDWRFIKLCSSFDTIAAIITSFIAAAALVNLVKDELELTNNPVFWFTVAIFIYTFCTYFIFSFVSDIAIREKLWWIHNLANISAYILYAYGYWLIIKKGQSKHFLEHGNIK